MYRFLLTLISISEAREPEFICEEAKVDNDNSEEILTILIAALG